jgi:HPt (histidine-containing phosphotransfer) domain-containing protein
MTLPPALIDDDVLRELRHLLGTGLEVVLNQFGVQARQLTRELVAAARADDTGTVRTLAHRLKGSAGTVGARRLGETAAALEQQAVAGDAVAVRVTLDALPALVEATLLAMQAPDR